MSNVKQFCDKDGNDIFPVTHASVVFDSEGNNFNTVHDELNKLNKTHMVSLTDFVTAGMTDHTQAFKNALQECIVQNKSLYVPDGTWTISESISITNPNNMYGGISIIGASRNTMIISKHAGFAFIMDSNRSTIENLTIECNNGNGIQCRFAQCNINNVTLLHCNIGVEFCNEAWCSNTSHLNMYSVKFGILMSQGCGGLVIGLDNMVGTAGYDNTIDDGSIGITCARGAGWAVIADGGQIDSFGSVFKLDNETSVGLTVNRVYIEHNFRIYSEDSIGYIEFLSTHMPCSYRDKNKNVIEKTLNGIHKTDIHNPCKDSAIPINRLLTYYTFNANNMFYDHSGNNTTISNIDRLILHDGENLYGKSKAIAAPNNGSISQLNINGLGDKFTVVMSFRHTTDQTANPLRILELNSKNPTTEHDLDFIFLSENGNSVSIADRSSGGSNPTGQLVLGVPPRYGDNAFCVLMFDLENGKYYGMVPDKPYVYEYEIEQLKGYANGNMKIGLFKNWAPGYPIMMNYFAVFDGILEYDQLLNIYNTTSPLISSNIIVSLDEQLQNINDDYHILNSTKADKNEVFSMANMGQDIKEAMTGGSVAVVGDNAILTNNIVDGQVTTAKLSDYEMHSLGKFDDCVGSAGGNTIWVSSKVFPKGHIDYINMKAQQSTSNARIVIYRKENENDLYYVYSKTCSLDVGVNVIPININMSTDFYIGVGSDINAIAYLNHGSGNPMTSFPFDDAKDHMNVAFNVNNSANYIFGVEVVFKSIKKRLADLERNQGKMQEWSGKKYIALGDSITRGENSLDSYNPMIGYRYTDLAKEELGFGSVVNYGIGGSRITSQSGNSNGMIDRYAGMDNDADLICVFGGTNDFGNDVPLGEIDDGDKTHFKYALNELCKGLLNKYPTKTIYFITPIHRNDHHPDNIPNNAGHVLKDYVDAIKEICENYGIPVLDLWSTYGISPFIQNQRDIYIPDGLHPTPEGMKILARKNNNFIRNL